MKPPTYKTQWEGFCVQGPSALYLLETFSMSTKGARRQFLAYQAKQVGFQFVKTWQAYYRRGYRVIPLTITTP